MNRKVLFGASITMIIVTILLIVTDSPILLVSVVPNIDFPLGNLFIWIGLVSFPLAIYTGSRQLFLPQTSAQRFFRVLIWLIIALNAAWGFVGYYYSGNWSFNFRNDHQSFVRYWYYIYLIVLSPIVFLVAFGLYRLVQFFQSEKVENVTTEH